MNEVTPIALLKQSVPPLPVAVIPGPARADGDMTRVVLWVVGPTGETPAGSVSCWPAARNPEAGTPAFAWPAGRAEAVARVACQMHGIFKRLCEVLEWTAVVKSESRCEEEMTEAAEAAGKLEWIISTIAKPSDMQTFYRQMGE